MSADFPKAQKVLSSSGFKTTIQEIQFLLVSVIEFVGGEIVFEIIVDNIDIENGDTTTTNAKVESTTT